MRAAAYFFLKEKSDRCEKYADADFDLVEVGDVFGNKALLGSTLSNVTNFMYMIDKSINYVFVIYEPNKDKLFLSEIGESDTPKCLIDTEEKAKKFSNYFHIMIPLKDMFDELVSLNNFSLSSLFGDQKEGYKEEIDDCNKSLSKYFTDFENLTKSFIKDFKKEFMF